MRNRLPRRPAFSRWGVPAVLVLIASWAFAQSNEGQDVSPKNSKPGTTAAKRAASTAGADKVIMTPERQAAALKFAELHHPELYELLQNLKQGRRPEYQQAVRQLYNDSERLARIKERMPTRYPLALTEWQLDSRLRLLVARMTMSVDDPDLAAELQELLKKRLDARLELLKLDRERLAGRLAKMDDQIQAIEEDRDSAIEKDLQRIKRSLGLNQRSPNRRKFPPRKPTRPIRPNPNQPPRRRATKDVFENVSGRR